MKLFCAILAGLLLCAAGCAGGVQPGKAEVTAEPTATAEPTVAPAETSAPLPDATAAPTSSSVPSSSGLMCEAQSLEEAQEIAALYDITLALYADGVALFSTSEDAKTVIARGKQNGWPELFVNGEVYAFSG